MITSALTAGIATGALSYPLVMPTCQWFGPVISHGRTDTSRIALTFDDGPWPGGTDPILDLLKRLRVHATFFVIGRNVDAHPELLKRIDAEGHAIGNHSYDHAGFGFLHGQAYWREQLERTDAAIERVIGRKPMIFRPPLGIKTPAILKAAANYRTITWSRRAMDGLTTSPHKILHRLTGSTRPGDIIALHDGVSPQSNRDPSATVRAVEPLVMRLRERGLEPVGLDEVLQGLLELPKIAAA